MLFPETDNWRAGMQDVSAAIDDTMGELVRVMPASPPAPNFPPAVDATRAVTVTAAFTREAKSVIMGDNVGRMGGGHSISPIVSTSKPVFSFGYGVVPFPIRQGYRITRLCNGEIFEVTDPKPDGVARIICEVVQLGREADAQ